MLSHDATLKLRDAGRARSDNERLICRILRTEGPFTVSELVPRVAQQMYDNALEHGGWIADIGLFGPRLFERDALAALQEMDERCISLKPDNSG